MNNTIKLPGQSADKARDLPELHQLAVDDLLSMPEEELEKRFDSENELPTPEVIRKRMTPDEIKTATSRFRFSPEQLKELWENRDKINEALFRCMAESAVVDCPSIRQYDENDNYIGIWGGGYHERYPGICPFTGLTADAVVSGGYESLLDYMAIEINKSIAIDLVNLMERTGVGIKDLLIVRKGNNGDNEVLRKGDILFNSFEPGDLEIA